MIKWHLEQRKISELKNWEKNPRTISEKAFKELEKSVDALGNFEPLVINIDGTVITGNQRLRLEMKKGNSEVDVYVPERELSEEEVKKIGVISNRHSGDWDMDILANEFEDILKELNFDDLLNNIPEIDIGVSGSLATEFGCPPFSILDTKQKYWQDRRNVWLSLGIESETGREKDLLHLSHLSTKYGARGGSGGDTSVFDPVLTEIMYKWFCPVGGKILDPFAGGSVRGIVAGLLGYKYCGNDLSGEQIEENRKQAKNILTMEQQPLWTVGDSLHIQNILPNNERFGKYDYIFSCPPYFDLEVYGDKEGELSAMEYDEFVEAYTKIIKNSVEMLGENRFATFVVSEVRGKDGYYRGFVPLTIKAFEDAGMRYYNEMILVNSAGSLPMRVKKHMKNRKVGRQHQNILNFYKGDVKEIQNNFSDIFIDNILLNSE